MPFEGFGFSRMEIGKGRGYLPPPDKKLLALVIALHNLTIKNTQYLHTYVHTYLSKYEVCIYQLPSAILRNRKFKARRNGKPSHGFHPTDARSERYFKL